MKSPLDLLGVTSLLGGEIAKGAVRYINANPRRCWTSFLVIPGMYDVASKMLKRSDSFISRVLSPGNREDKRLLVGFDDSGKYKYTGTISGTQSNVKNALCEGWLNMSWISDNVHIHNSYLFDESERSTTVLSGLVSVSKHGKRVECFESENALMAVSAFLQICTFAALAYMIKIKDIAGITISAANMVSNFLMATSITADKYKVPESKASIGVPKGNAIVVDQANNRISVIMGEERQIQSFMQLEVEVEEAKYRYDALAATIGCITTIGTLLFTPIMSDVGQLIFASELVIGLLSGMTFSSRNGDRLLEKMANKYYSEDHEISRTKTQYTNRTTAVAAALMETGGQAKNITDLLPSYDACRYYALYYELLDNVVKNKSNIKQISSFKSLNDAVNYICTTFPDSAGELLTHSNTSEWPGRLVVDIIEAIAQTQKSKPSWNRTNVYQPPPISTQ
jgi:hypothetical protein